MSTRSTANPTVRRRELARRLRELRQAAGVSLEDVAKELMCSTAKVSRMETGERAVQARDLRDLCRFYAVSDAERDDLMKLAREAAQRGWWQNFSPFDQVVGNFVALESAAEEIRLAHALIVPGLLQTTEYTRSLIPGLRPPGEMTDQAVREAVELRAARQKRLLHGEVRYRAVLDEAAFRRVVGTAEVMERQVAWMIELADLPTVSIQVIPFLTGPHPAQEGSFQLLDMGPRMDDVIFVEGLLGSYLLDDVASVDKYKKIYTYLAEHVALNVQESLAWLEKVRLEWRR